MNSRIIANQWLYKYYCTWLSKIIQVSLLYVHYPKCLANGFRSKVLLVSAGMLEHTPLKNILLVRLVLHGIFYLYNEYLVLGMVLIMQQMTVDMQ